MEKLAFRMPGCSDFLRERYRYAAPAFRNYRTGQSKYHPHCFVIFFDKLRPGDDYTGQESRGGLGVSLQLIPFFCEIQSSADGIYSVSYTHLDVYKRQRCYF